MADCGRSAAARPPEGVLKAVIHRLWATFTHISSPLTAGDPKTMSTGGSPEQPGFPRSPRRIGRRSLHHPHHRALVHRIHSLWITSVHNLGTAGRGPVHHSSPGHPQPARLVVHVVEKPLTREETCSRPPLPTPRSQPVGKHPPQPRCTGGQLCPPVIPRCVPRPATVPAHAISARSPRRVLG